MPKTISEHIIEVMALLDKVERLEGERRVTAINNLQELFSAIQEGAYVVAPLYPDTDKLTPIVEEYRKGLKPSDVLDDPPGPFRYGPR